MSSNHSEGWSLSIGRWRGVDIRLHIFLPLLALVTLLAVRLDLLDARFGFWLFVVLLGSVTIHELFRVISAWRVGGHLSTFMLSPISGTSRVHLPFDPPAHLITALTAPMTCLVLMVSAGCGLALAGDRQFLELLNLGDPGITATGLDAATLPQLLAQLVIWVNWWLLLISLLPVYPCPGAELLRGVLWPMVGRPTANAATAHVALGASFIMTLMAVILLRNESSPGMIPGWFPLSVISIFLLYGGCRSIQSRRYVAGFEFEEFDSDDDQWLVTDWYDEDREAVLVEHVPDKQQEILDQKRKEREAHEDARVDAILQRLSKTSLEQLSDEEQAVLKRASRRYRKRRSTEQE